MDQETIGRPGAAAAGSPSAPASGSVAAAGADRRSAAAPADPRSNRPVLQVRNLRKHFLRADGTRVPAIDDISFDLHAGEFMVLLGPSGCGKTTLLRSVAGLERPTSGSVIVGDRTVFDSEQKTFLPPERRRLSMVFQSYALWPHMTVFQNIAYPLRSGPGRAPRKAQLSEQVERMLVTMRLEGLAKQYPNQLSGGQQQRVALCRALVAGSNVVLFDEPLSNVDAKVRETLRIELLLMQRELGFAALFVTHDQQEALALAHSIALLDRGKVVQHGPPSDIYRRPATAGAAAFVGFANQLTGDVVELAGGRGVLRTAIGTVSGTDPTPGASELVVGGTATLMWRPDAFEVTPLTGDEPATCRWTGAIDQSWYHGTFSESLVRIGEQQFRAQIPGTVPLPAGTRVGLELDPQRVFLYPDIPSETV